MGFFDFIKQQDRMRLFRDRFSQQTALIKSDITWRRSDQARHCVTLHVLGHIEANQLNTQDEGKLTCNLSLSNTGRPGKQKGSDRLFGFTQP